MKFSSETLNILKNMMNINNSIKLNPGNLLTTKSNNSVIYMESPIEETIPCTVPIYDLKSFLSSLALLGDDSDVLFDDVQKIILLKNKRASIKYNMADESVIISPLARFKKPETHVEFTLTVDELTQILKACSALALETILITKQDNNIIIQVINPEDPKSNTFSLIVGESSDDSEFSFYVNLKNLKLLHIDYKVSIAAQGVIMFEELNNIDGIKYVTTLEVDSHSSFIGE